MTKWINFSPNAVNIKILIFTFTKNIFFKFCIFGLGNKKTNGLSCSNITGECNEAQGLSCQGDASFKKCS
jgi:hypothetical protein